jgi:alpha-L-rhamnosidase
MTKKIFITSLFLILWLLLPSESGAQKIDPAVLQNRWKASWVMVPGINPEAYGVYLFRKKIILPVVPESFPVYVSADNRYKLFVNERLVSVGPARGDLTHWNFEIVDLAPYLHAGQNIISSLIWNDGEYRPEAQISDKTGFIMQGATDEAQILNTNNTWKCIEDKSYKPVRTMVAGYYVAGPGEEIDMQLKNVNWDKLSFDDSGWSNAQTVSVGIPKYTIGLDGPDIWMLVPSVLPQMEMKQQRLEKVRKAEGITVPATFPATKTAITVSANTTATILLDQTFLTNAYPTLIFSGGKRSTITLTYSEALFGNNSEKGNRNDIEGKRMTGRKDVIISNGTDSQTFTSLTWRTYRYLQIQIETKETPLVLEDVFGTFTGFPFQLNAKLETDNVDMQKIMEIGWRTARLCAVETYMDCPFYEQLQYVGDTRIQAMVSFYNSGDDRLVRNALNLIDYSRQPEGLTLSRYPTVTHQIIPTFSLWYIGMLYDYMMYGSDSVFIKNKLLGERQILNYFQSFEQPDGSLNNVPYWTFTDWVNTKGWQSGMGPFGKDRCSAILDFQLLLAYQTAAVLEQKMGMKEYASMYIQKAQQLIVTIRNKYWDNTRKLFADTPEKDLFSQHANSLAILTGMVNGDEAADMGKLLISDSSLAPASIYFKYYLHQALVKAGMGNDYLNWLGKWRENITLGLTTWAETSEVSRSRSDCHAWGASPNIEFFRTVLGIDSDAPGFKKVKIEPHLGSIAKIGGEMPHPAGKILVRYDNSGKQINAEITLPEKVTGTFIWKGRSYDLKEGKNVFSWE